MLLRHLERCSKALLQTNELLGEKHLVFAFMVMAIHDCLGGWPAVLAWPISFVLAIYFATPVGIAVLVVVVVGVAVGVVVVVVMVMVVAVAVAVAVVVVVAAAVVVVVVAVVVVVVSAVVAPSRDSAQAAAHSL